ncbi:EF-hand domain-containing protein [Emcibacter sp.]|uniref:EF-hand domain-containing protein n=1 Tax=Emcibacter sp. TaxID=1979954 RepID=UPI002AA6217A|nr:EF-hand domain-containing protein [Emcibacter sp.]
MKKISIAIVSGILVVSGAGMAIAQTIPQGPGPLKGGHPGWTQGMGHGKHGSMGMFRELMDADGDGNISKQEIAKFHEDRINQADRNKDGSLSLEEFDVMQEALMEEAKKLHLKKKFDRLDANGDGRVSAEEMTAHHGMMFDRMDRNDDGMIGPDDRPHKKK